MADAGCAAMQSHGGTGVTTLTADMVLAAFKSAQEMVAKISPPLDIHFTTAALEETEERLFPVSKHRSKRIHKKLVKRFGGEFKKEPAMWKVGNVIYAHPIYRQRIEAEFKQRSDEMMTNAMMLGTLGMPRW